MKSREYFEGTMYGGAFSGVVGRLALHPIDTCKAKLQVNKEYSHVSSVLKATLKNEVSHVLGPYLPPVSIFPLFFIFKIVYVNYLFQQFLWTLLQDFWQRWWHVYCLYRLMWPNSNFKLKENFK
eukprot:GHVL01011050.1.p1 GENE.GHVL01011050.1~~GHVL01011050.1.p1  ORF type:complete len:124 (+),score=1.39 GHVL01011050.1:62-433(+)